MRFQAMILGTYHMNNSPNLFTHYDDVTTQKRQREIEEVVDCLIAYQPTKIAVEAVAENQDILDGEYQHYLRGDWPLPPSERYQLGFRIGERLEHPRVYAIDCQYEGGPGIDGVYTYAQAHYPDIYEFIHTGGEAFNTDIQYRIDTQTVREVLCWLNQSHASQLAQQMHMAMLRVADRANRMGLDWVAGWYQRNLTIYANFLRWTEPGDRWLIIYGDGHSPLLHQFLQDTADCAVVPAEEYLRSRR